MITNVSSFENDFDLKLPSLEDEIKYVAKEYLDGT